MVMLLPNIKRKLFCLLLMALTAGSASGTGKLSSPLSFISVAESGSQEPGVQKLIRIDTAGVGIIPPSTGIQFIGNRILFLADSRMEEKMISPHVSFGKIQAYTALPGEIALAGINIFSPAREFPYPSDAVAINNNFTRLYYTAKASRRKPEKIYEAAVRLTASGQIEWTGRGKPLNFCNDGNIYTHPALSSDGSFMVFSSDMSGTNGGLDLFISFMEGDAWSEPRNLGAGINSYGNEMYPFLDARNNLYFSSDKTGGSGGYDIYVAVLDGTDWFEAVNLTPMVNTADDDLAFRIDNIGQETAFFTVRDITGTNGIHLMKMWPDASAQVIGKQDLAGLITEMIIKDESPGEKKIAYSLRQPVVYPEPVQVVEQPLDQILAAEVSAPTEIIEADAISVVKEEEAMEDEKEVDEADQPLAHLPLAEVKLPPEPERNTTARVTGTPSSGRTVQPAEPSAEARDTEENAIYLSSSSEIIEGVVYRVQFSASMTPKESIEVTIEGNRYNTFGYFYGGAYRTTVGEFNTLAEARTLQNVMRKLGYNQAFVVAFRNGERIVYYLNRDTY
jgi:hypothetical protein